MLQPRSGLPKFCSWNLDRENGKRRVRFRKNGFSTYLTGTPWSEDFMRQRAAALDGVKAQPSNIGVERTRPGTVNALIASYYALVFPTLKRSTQKSRRAACWSASAASMVTNQSLGSNRRTLQVSSPPRQRRQRKLTATRLDAGCSEREIMAVTGHRSVAEVSRYVKAAEQSRLAERAMEKLSKRREVR